MTDTLEYTRCVQSAAERIYAVVSQSGEASSWELKLSLKLHGTILNLALGHLLARGMITLRPDGLTLKIKPVTQNEHGPLVPEKK